MLAALGSAGVLAGCGGGAESSVTGGEPISFERLSQAAVASADATSGRFEFSFEMTLPGTEKPFALSGDGAFDASTNRNAISIDFSLFAELFASTFSGLGNMPADAPDFGDAEAWKIDVRQDGEVVYVHFPLLSSELPADKSWVRMDVGNALEGSEFDLSALHELAGNPRDMLDFLRAASGEIETVGVETLRGVDTTRYRATLNLADYENLVPADRREELRSILGELIEQSGLGEIPVDVWLDDFGLVRKFEMSFTATQPGTTNTAEASTTFELYDYGKPVDVAPPPADEVVDASSLG